MEGVNQAQPRQYRVHKILAHSYSMYLILFLVGVSLDLIFKFKIFTHFIWAYIGITLLIIGTVFVFWAQKTSRNLDIKNLTKEAFNKGPYRHTRGPTHLGLFFLVLGFGIIANAFFVILTTVISFVIGKFFFLEKQENVLAEKYGTPYIEYKKSVKF